MILHYGFGDAQLFQRYEALFAPMTAAFDPAKGQFNATTCAAHVGRHDETVLGWVHAYNERGPEALAYRRTGGRAPLLANARRN